MIHAVVPDHDMVWAVVHERRPHFLKEVEKCLNSDS